MRMMFTAILAIAAFVAVDEAGAVEGDIDFFETRIRPLLVERCVGCHSSATGKTSGGLALDTREAWQHGGDSGPAIVPGKLEESLLITAIRYSEGGPQMPPEGKGRGKLPAAEIALLEEWVKQGAPDPREAAQRIGGMTLDQAKSWWAFQPLHSVSPPSGANSFAAAVTNDIDQFIGHALQEKCLRPLQLAPKQILLRRATFDLTGFPPTPEEVQAFLADDSSDAFEKVVDRLLASTAYGERWGRHWLDVARYADTAGDGADYPVREAYLYRDWVVRALNRDQPFNEFIRQQIAGDIIATHRPPEEYADCVTATGFLAVGKRYGYSPSPDFQHLDFADVIDSVGRSILGLSIGCARCHDHKFDPVSTQDYYAFYGIMQSTKWAFPGGEEHKRPANFPPLVPPVQVELLDRQKQESLAKLDTQINELKAEQSKYADHYFAGGIDLAFEGQEPKKPPSGAWLSIGPNEVIAEAQSPYATIHPQGTRGVRLGSGQPNEGIRYVWPDKRHISDGKPIHFAIDFRTLASDKTGAYRFYLGRGVIESLAVQLSITTSEICIAVGDKWQTLRKLEPDKWYTLRLTFDPQQKTLSGVVGTPDDITTISATAWNPAWDGVLDTFICDAIGHVAGLAPVRDLDNLGLQSEAFAVAQAESIAAQQPTANSKERFTELVGQIDQLAKERKSLADKSFYATAYGVSEAVPVNAKVQKRGDPLMLGEEVPRRHLAVLGGEQLDPTVKSSGRLELANWLVDESRPLAARVFVNRVWQWHFGRGLVETSSDFGSRGAMPTHPELLEWLTGKFLESGGSVKSLHRLIMNSRTYQLASDDDVDNLQIDPSNRWHWRYTRRPLDAEAIRDAMLYVSGHLDPSPAGPHPFPPTESWGFTIHSPFHAVYDSNHRSIYLMVQRNRRHPYLGMFDAADPNTSVGERLQTTTPTQALYYMNSPFVHEQARGFGERIMKLHASEQDRIVHAITIAHGKSATELQIVKLKAFLATYRTKLSALGHPPDQIESESWYALARVLLTSNEFLFVE